MEENRKYCIIICFLFYSLLAYGQKQKYLFIRILDEQNIPIQDANIFLEDTFCCITNVDGFAKITLQDANAFKITLNHLAFETKDTVVNAQNKQLNLTIQLKPIIYPIDEVTISPTEHITDLENKYFSDIYLIENHIVALLSKGNQAYLKFYDSLGNYSQLTYKFEQRGKFQSVGKGYISGQYYLIGTGECIPFTIKKNSNFSVKEEPMISRKKYDNTFEDILFFKDSLLIKKEVSSHRNKVDIYTYNTKNLNRKLVHNIFNKTNAKEANRNYNIIKSIYLRNLKIQDPKDIDFGVERQDITKNTNWDGNILDLIVNNEQLPYVSSFQVATQGVNFDTKLDRQFFLVLDNVQYNLVYFDLSISKLNAQVVLPESKNDFKFMLSNVNVCIHDEDSFYCWNEFSSVWDKLNINAKNIFYPKRNILIDKHIFILGRKSINVVNNQVFMLNYKDF